MAHGPALFVAMLVAFVAPAVAPAATTVTYTGTGPLSVTADAINNSISVTQSGNTVTISDLNQMPGTGFSVGGSCSYPGSGVTVTCTGVNAALGINISLEAGNDVVAAITWPDCPAGPTYCATIIGGPGDDQLSGSPGADYINGGANNDQIYGEGGQDLGLFGSAGDDQMDGGPGDDNVVGGPGADVFTGDDAGFDAVFYDYSLDGRTTGISATVDGAANDGSLDFDTNGVTATMDNVGPGIDQIVGTEYDDVITGGSRGEVLEGLGGNDQLTGNGGSDHLRGAAGGDTLNAQDSAADAEIDCGADTDTANVDPSDPASVGCETVSGASAPPHPGTPPPATPPPAPPPGSTTPPPAGPVAQPKPTRVYEMPDVEPVKRKRRKPGKGKARWYAYHTVGRALAIMRSDGICPLVAADCTDEELQVDLRIEGGKAVSKRYRGDAPNKRVWASEPDGGADLSAGQQVTLYYVDPALDNDKRCGLNLGAQEVHIAIAAMTFEEAQAWFKERDCKEGRDWRVVKRETVANLVGLSRIVGVTRGRHNGRDTYDLTVWSRDTAPKCTFERVDQPFILETFRNQGVKTAAEALALMAREGCEATVAKTTITDVATDPVVDAAFKFRETSVYGDYYRFELWIKQYVPKRQPGEEPRPGDPVQARPDFCASSVTFGPLSLTGACLKREGFTWVSSAEVAVNGLKIQPAGGAKVVIDPLNLRVAVTGEASVVLDAMLGNVQVGPVTLYKGRFDWVLQGGLPSTAGVFTPISGAGSLPLGTVQRLPGLGGAGSLPKLGGLSLPNFGGLDAAALQRLVARVPKLDFPNVEIPASVIPEFTPEIAFAVPGGIGDFLGFPLAGEVTLRLENRNGLRGVRVGTNLALPAVFQGVTGEAAVFVGSDGSVVADRIAMSANELWAGPVKLAPVAIEFNGANNTWTGETTAYLFPGGPGFGGSFFVRNGQLEAVGLTISGELPLGPIVLNEFKGALQFAPLRASGTLKASAGPTVPGLGRLVGLDAAYEFDAEVLRVKAGVNVANVQLANALVEYFTSGVFHARGELSYYIDSAREYGFGGVVEGYVSSQAFNVSGDVEFRAKSLRLAGRGVVSSNGVAACAIVEGPLWSRAELGAGYRWGASKVDWIGGYCDLGPYSAAVSRSAVRQAGTNGVTLPGGLDVASIAVQGAGAPPRVTVTGPQGETVTAPAGGESLQDERFIVVQQDADDTTYVAIAQPAAGEWKVTTAAGSAPVVKVLSAQALPDPKVTAKVTGKGAARTLRYTVKPIPGQAVRFAEQGQGVGADVGVAKGAKGMLKFRPAAGGAITRTVVAIIEQGGMVRTTKVVARYRAPGAELAAPRVKAKRTRAGLALAWTPVAGAQGYRVSATLNGRTEFVSVKGRRTEIDGLLPASPATAVVQALGGADGLGREGKARVKAGKVRRRGG